MDEEDLIEKILDGLDNNCKPIIEVITDRETPISFEELHEKLINKELTLHHSQSSSTLLSASTIRRPNSRNPCNKPWHPPSSMNFSSPAFRNVGP